MASREVSVTVYRVTRTTNSASGNPRFVFHTDGGRFTTASDYSINYDVENVWNVGQTIDRPAVLVLDRDKVTDWRIDK